MKYTAKKFSVPIDSNEYRSEWERIFTGKPTTIAIRTFNCDLDAHEACPRTLGMDWAHCDCQCHELAATP